MEKLSQLKDVQEVDKLIYTAGKRIALIPKEIENAKSELNSQKEAVKSAEQALKDFQVKQKSKEVELGTKEDQRRKLEGQLNLVKTNQEYSALQKEINNFKADSSMLEEEILKCMEEGDSYRRRIESEKKILLEKTKEFEVEEKKLLEEKKKDETELETLKSKKKELLTGIDPELLNLYERILVKKDGIALVPAVNGTCSGCSMQLRPQLFDQLHVKDKVVICENCSRILFLEQ